MGLLTGTITQLKDFGSQIARTSRRFVACNFLNKVMVVHPDAAAVMWDAVGDSVSLIPGLPISEYYRGVNAFQGFLIVWAGERMKWSDQNDYTMWIPVGATAGSFVFKLTQPYTLGVTGIDSVTVRVDQDPTGLIVGQFCRIDTDPYYTFFKVGSVLPATGQIGVLSGFSQSVSPNETKVIFIQKYIPYVSGTQLYAASLPAILMEVTDTVAQQGAVSLVLAEGFAQPAVNAVVTIKLTSLPAVTPGSYVSVGPVTVAGVDIYRVNSVDPVNYTVSMVRMGVESSWSIYHNAGEYVVDQPNVSVRNLDNALTVTTGFAEPLNEVFGFTLVPQDLTGPAAPGTVFPINTEVFTVDKNAAGETVNTGSAINGRILHFDTIGDYGYIIKHRSIQSVQYVGPEQGTFFIRPEVTDEGMVGDYAFVKVGNDQIFIWGNKGIYRYTGFTQLVAVGQQHFKQLKAELDQTRANQIVGFHNEKDYEVWFIYPRITQEGVDSLRVFIFNYIENSVTIDDYSGSFGSMTAAGRIEVNQDLTWANTIGTWSFPKSFLFAAQWVDEAADSSPAIGIIGVESNSPPYQASMTLLAAQQLYYSAHPSTRPIITDPVLFINWLNTYWQTHGGWPALSVINDVSPADRQILQAFGYQAGIGISTYLLANSSSSAAGLEVYDNGETARNNDPVRCSYESVDHDGGDPLAWKYADTQWFSIQVKSKVSVKMPILVYIGSKANYDDDVAWSQPIVLMVSGNMNYVTKTNVKAAGRYFRIKLQASTPGMSFRVSQVRILGRLGATY